MDPNRSLSSYSYELPAELIAQHPTPRRDASRLLVLERQSGSIRHDRFECLPKYLKAGDLLVMNNTRVLPVKLLGRTPTGGRVEALLVRRIGGDSWEALLKCGRKLHRGEQLEFEQGRITGRFTGEQQNGSKVVDLRAEGEIGAILERFGRMPLPPYIKRQSDDPYAREDRERYQTVFAREPGAIAAPTAGLHFTKELLLRLQEAGVNATYVTLHVGLGTFKPVKCDRVTDHQMEAEQYEVLPEAAAAIVAARKAGGRIVVVGTTCCRVLETAAAGSPRGEIEPGRGWTSLFVHPPYDFRCTDALITNFHLPRTTLLMLVSALAGRDRVLAAYNEAVKQRYRFYSYGDAMLIL